MSNLLPCKTCPWRVDRDARTIPGYDHDLAVSLLKTVGPGDEFRSIMACHGSSESQSQACRGYLARAGWSNLTVRMMLARGKIENPDQVDEACREAGVELEPDYPTALAKMARSLEELN